MESNNDKVIETSDLVLASYLITKGACLQNIKKGFPRSTFILSGIDDTMQKSFWENPMINLHQFVSAHNYLKKSLFTITSQATFKKELL